MEIIACYYDTQTSGQSDTGKGTPQTTTEMKSQATFQNWDFASLWNINAGINSGYPNLRLGLTGIYARPYCQHYDLKKRAASLVRRGVDAATGAQMINKQLIKVNGAIPVAFSMTYNSLMLAEGPLGKGWGHNYEANLQVQEDGNIRLYWNANRYNLFLSEGYPGPLLAGENNAFLSEDYNQYGSLDQACRLDLLVENEDDSYTLTRRDQSKYNFNAAGKLTQIQNGHGQVIKGQAGTVLDLRYTKEVREQSFCFQLI
jgi:hypothetical protein